MRRLYSALFATALLAAAQPGSAAAPGGHMGGMSSMGASHAGMASSMSPMGQSMSLGASGRLNRGLDTSFAQSAAASRASRASPDSLLGRNTGLDAQLEKLLPAGTSAQSACQGFAHLGQCVATLHVASNLGLSFDELKSRTTGTDAVKLGTAIHDLAPDANAKREQRKAEGQAEQDISDNLRISP